MSSINPAAARSGMARQKSRQQGLDQLQKKAQNQISGDSASGGSSFDIGTGLGEGNMTGSREERLKKASNKLEGLLVGRLMKQMRKTVPESELFGGGYGGKMFRTQLDRKYSQLVAQNSDLGLAQNIQRGFTQ